MAKINIRGIGKISVSREVGEDISKFKNDNNYLPNDRYMKNGMDFEKRDIGGIVINDFEVDDSASSDDRKQENAAYYEKIQNDYEAEIRRRVFMFPEHKAEDTRLAEFLYEVMYNAKPSDAFKQEIIARQTAYFTKFPKHPYAPIVFKDLLPESKGSEMRMSTMLPSFTLKKVEDIMQEAFRTAHQMKLL
jgi:hypothetical protein